MSTFECKLKYVTKPELNDLLNRSALIDILSLPNTELIDSCVFKDNKYIQTVKAPSIKMLGASSFENSNVESFQGSPMRINTRAFYDSALKEINKLKDCYIRQDAFAYTKLQNINLKSCTIQSDAFQKISSFETINLEYCDIFNDAFYDCNIKKLEINGGNINNRAFNGCRIDALIINTQLKYMHFDWLENLNVKNIIISSKDATLINTLEKYNHAFTVEDSLDSLISQNKSFKEINNHFLEKENKGEEK